MQIKSPRCFVRIFLFGLTTAMAVLVTAAAVAADPPKPAPVRDAVVAPATTNTPAESAPADETSKGDEPKLSPKELVAIAESKKAADQFKALVDAGKAPAKASLFLTDYFRSAKIADVDIKTFMMRHFPTNEVVLTYLAGKGLPKGSTDYGPMLDAAKAQIKDRVAAGLPVLEGTTDAGAAQLEEVSGLWKVLGFGAGLSLTMDIGAHDRVDRATLDADRRIRVEEDHNAVPRFVLETHFFFEPKENSFLKLVEPGEWGHGPFIAVEPGGDTIINAVGAGWMLGFKRKQPREATVVDSFNLGLGIMVDPSVQVLGDGQKPNQQLDADEQIRYKTTHQIGVLFMFSVGF